MLLPERLKGRSDKRESLPRSGAHQNIHRNMSPVHIAPHRHHRWLHPSKGYVYVLGVSADLAPHLLPVAPVVHFSKVGVACAVLAHVPVLSWASGAVKSEIPVHTMLPPASGET